MMTRLLPTEGPDGTLSVIASHIPDMSWFKPQNVPRLRTELFRITPSR